MIQSCGELDLSQKTIRPERSCQFRMEHFQSYNAIVLQILREINSRHPTAAEFAIDRVGISESAAKLFAR